MTRRRKIWAAGAAAVLALAGGALVWGIGRGDGSGDALADRCGGSLAVDEARKFFDGAELDMSGHAAEWVGHRTEWCSVRARGDEKSPELRVQIRPAAAHRSSGAAEQPGAAPIGHGWNGSFIVRGGPEAAVLVDCAPLAGQGLLVLTRAPEFARELSAAQVTQVARLATETARRAAERFGCEGELGERPTTVDRPTGTTRPVAEATGTCRGAVSRDVAEALRATAVREGEAGRTLTEECEVERGEHGDLVLTAYYGPSSEQERYLDRRYPGSVTGSRTRSHPCPGALGTGYFKLTPPKGEDGEPTSVDEATSEAMTDVLAAFASASGARHGCQVS
ncbi:hypothetical protein [Streptomyces sp. NPDC014744]|uniref:hypothetical protein n=1 Tax=Streptomyces sp. NPDC014744 TaxID=3364903 RepID=UPI0036FC2B58